MLLNPLEIGELAGVAAAALGGWLLYRSAYVAVPPNKALVLFGSRSHRRPDLDASGAPSVVARAPRVLIGGGTVLGPWNKAYSYLSLAPVDVETSVRAIHGVDGRAAHGWEVTLAVEAKIPAEPTALLAAAENLLGLGPAEMAAFVRRAVEASVPVVLSRLDTGDSEPDWERLGVEIQATVGPELVRSGLVVRSVAVRELRRLAPLAATSAPSEPRARAGRSGAVVATAGPSDLDLRLERIERGLRVMGAQVNRWLAGEPEGRYVGERPPSLALDTPVVARDGDRSYDSMEDGRTSPVRRPLPAAGAGDEGPPTSSDEGTPR